MKFLWNIFKSIVGVFFLLLIKIYQYLISPILPNRAGIRQRARNTALRP
jgi:hypothetical protein